MRIAHIADTHLGYRQYNLDEREQDLYDVFNELIDRIIEERPDIIIHAGDLFDSPNPRIKALYTVKKALKKLDGKIPFYCILGDHDIPKRRAMPPQALFDVKILGVYSLGYVKHNGVLIAGISNIKGRAIPILKKELKKFEVIAKDYKKSILVLHQAIKTFLPFPGAYEITENDLPRGVTYYAMGHIHSREISRFGTGILAYSGSTEILRKDEISSWEKKGKGFFIVDIDQDEPEIHKINLGVRPQINLVIEPDKINIIREELFKYNTTKKPILHVTVKGKNIRRNLVIHRISDLVKDKVLCHRIRFSEEHQELRYDPNKRPNIADILKNLLGEELSDLAIDLYGRLSENDVDGAIEIAKKSLGVDLNVIEED